MSGFVNVPEGHRARFEVPGGRIDVTLGEDGALHVHGVNEYADHYSRLVVSPESANDVTVSLMRTDHRA